MSQLLKTAAFEKYDVFKFMQSKQGIEIKPNFISIPEEIKTEFWNSFNQTTRDILNNFFPKKVAESKALCTAYMSLEAGMLTNKHAPNNPGNMLSDAFAKIRRRLSNKMLLRDIIITGELRSYLENPEIKLAEEINDPLMDIIIGRLDEDRALASITEKLTAKHRNLYYSAAVLHVLLKLLSDLSADRLYNIPVRNINIRIIAKRAQLRLLEIDWRNAPESLQQAVFNDRIDNITDEVVQSAKKSDIISLTHEYHSTVPTLSVPDAIVHSKRTDLRGEYIAIATNPHPATQRAININKERRYLMFAGTYGHDLSNAIFVYTGQKPDDIALVADDMRLCAPDLVIDFYDDESIKSCGIERKLGFYKQTLKPDAGIHLFCPGNLALTTNKLQQDDRVSIYKFDPASASLTAPIIKALSKK